MAMKHEHMQQTANRLISADEQGRQRGRGGACSSLSSDGAGLADDAHEAGFAILQFGVRRYNRSPAAEVFSSY